MSQSEVDIPNNKSLEEIVFDGKCILILYSAKRTQKQNIRGMFMVVVAQFYIILVHLPNNGNSYICRTFTIIAFCLLLRFNLKIHLYQFDSLRQNMMEILIYNPQKMLSRCFNITFYSEHLYFMKLYLYTEKPQQPEQLIPY